MDAPTSPTPTPEQASQVQTFYHILTNEIKLIKEASKELKENQSLCGLALISTTLRGGLHQITEMLRQILMILTGGPPLPPR
jgi:hypothetical protein